MRIKELILFAVLLGMNSCKNHSKEAIGNRTVNQNLSKTNSSASSITKVEALKVNIDDTAALANYSLFSRMFICCRQTPLYSNAEPGKIIKLIKPGTKVILKSEYLSLKEGFTPDTCCAASFKINGHTYSGYLNANNIGIGSYLNLFGKRYILAARYKEYTENSMDSVHKDGLAEVMLMDKGKIISSLQIQANNAINLFSFKNNKFPKPIKLFIMSDEFDGCEYSRVETLFYLDSLKLIKVYSGTVFEDEGIYDTYHYIMPGEKRGKADELKILFRHIIENDTTRSLHISDSLAETFYHFDGKHFVKKGTASLLLK